MEQHDDEIPLLHDTMELEQPGTEDAEKRSSGGNLQALQVFEIQ